MTTPSGPPVTPPPPEGTVRGKGTTLLRTVRGKGTLLRTVRAVAWSLIGLRKGSEYRKDVENLHPLHIIAVGLVAVFLLVAGLMVLVHWIV